MVSGNILVDSFPSLSGLTPPLTGDVLGTGAQLVGDVGVDGPAWLKVLSVIIS